MTLQSLVCRGVRVRSTSTWGDPALQGLKRPFISSLLFRVYGLGFEVVCMFRVVGTECGLEYLESFMCEWDLL